MSENVDATARCRIFMTITSKRYFVGYAKGATGTTRRGSSVALPMFRDDPDEAVIFESTRAALAESRHWPMQILFDIEGVDEVGDE